MTELRGLEEVVILNRIVKVSLVRKLHFERAFEGAALVNILRALGGQNSQCSQCKGPETEA